MTEEDSLVQARVLPRSYVQDLDLFLMSFLGAHALTTALSAAFSAPSLEIGTLVSPGVVRTLVDQLWMMSVVHIALSLYLGTRHTLVWLLLVNGVVAVPLCDFAGYVLPWGQVSYWLATAIARLWTAVGHGEVPQWVDPVLWRRGIFASAAGILFLFVQAGLLGSDVIARHKAVGGWGQRFVLRLAFVIGAAVVTLVLIRQAETGEVGGIFVTRRECCFGPPLHGLASLAMLRAVPDKLAGVVLVFAAIVIPMIWPWARADVLRTGPMKGWWRLCCCALLAVTIGLGYLGTFSTFDAVMPIAQVLVLLYFAFFASPFLLHWLDSRNGRSPPGSAAL
ncbi:MAG: hypothetical protein FWD68_09940 [Alphaproteobacteria bacterium]|nr:hypothetical protein [Alphaproteobacteria bacterium]